jgi:hypothetical protein
MWALKFRLTVGAADRLDAEHEYTDVRELVRVCTTTSAAGLR